MVTSDVGWESAIRGFGPDCFPRARLHLILLALLSLSACQFSASGSTHEFASGSGAPTQFVAPGTPQPAWADRVLAYTPVKAMSWPYSSDPALAVGAPGGPDNVLRLGNGGSASIGFGEGGARRCIVDGTGPDFIVFSSAVPVTDPVDGPGTYSQVMLVELSPDGLAWHAMPYHTVTSDPYVDPARYDVGLAGVSPTVGTGSAARGGDAFDLADVRDLGGVVCAVRVTDAWGVVADYGDTQPDPWQGGAGIDTIRALYTIPAPGTLP